MISTLIFSNHNKVEQSMFIVAHKMNCKVCCYKKPTGWEYYRIVSHVSEGRTAPVCDWWGVLSGLKHHSTECIWSYGLQLIMGCNMIDYSKSHRFDFTAVMRRQIHVQVLCSEFYKYLTLWNKLTALQLTQSMFCLQLLNVTDGIFNFTEIRGPPGPMVRRNKLLTQSDKAFSDVSRCYNFRSLQTTGNTDRRSITKRLCPLTFVILQLHIYK